MFQKLGVERVEPGQKAPPHPYGLKKEMAQNSMELRRLASVPTHPQDPPRRNNGPSQAARECNRVCAHRRMRVRERNRERELLGRIRMRVSELLVQDAQLFKTG